MLHIILGILKIIGLLLGIILLLLLSVFLAVLFVPVRYRGRLVRNQETTQARLRVTWLLRLISVAASFDLAQGRPVIEICLFGIPLARLRELLRKRKNRPPKRKKEKPTKCRRENPPKEKPLGPIKDEEQESLTAPLSKEAEPEISEEEIPPTALPEEEAADWTPESSPEEDAPSPIWPEPPAQEEDAPLPDGPEPPAQEEDAPLPDGPEPPAREEDTPSPTGPEPSSSEDNAPPPNEAEAPPPEEKRRIWERLSALGDKIRGLFHMLRNIGDKVKRFLEKLYRILSGVPGSLEKVGQSVAARVQKLRGFLDMLEEYEAKAVLGDVNKEFMTLLRHYRPREITGRLHFGTGDPAATGELTGFLYLLLPARAQLSVEPEFTEPAFEADLEFAGHIRTVHLIRAACHLLRNKRFMRLVKRLRKR